MTVGAWPRQTRKMATAYSVTILSSVNVDNCSYCMGASRAVVVVVSCSGERVQYSRPLPGARHHDGPLGWSGDLGEQVEHAGLDPDVGALDLALGTGHGGVAGA